MNIHHQHTPEGRCIELCGRCGGPLGSAPVLVQPDREWTCEGCYSAALAAMERTLRPVSAMVAAGSRGNPLEVSR